MPFPRLTPEQLQTLDVTAPRYTSYPTVPEWTDTFGAEDHTRALEVAGRAGAPLSLYVHIPFCREMCTYCGCHVIVSRDGRRAEPYLAALRAELALVSRKLGNGISLDRIHLGGGTPTFLDERQLTALWQSIVDAFPVVDGGELSVEVDPVVTHATQLALLAGFGWNRISMGVQDFDPGVQQAVNRIQSFEETRDLIAMARGVGFRSVNLDLIYGLPRQTPASWARTIERVASLRPDRISMFSFAYVPAARPNQRKLPMAEIPVGGAKLELFRIAYEGLEAAGYRPIGMDHFALAEDELARAQDRGELWRDFQGYVAGRPAGTVAVGVSSISDLGGAYAQNQKSLVAHANAVAGAHLPTSRGIWLTEEDRRRRDLIVQVMCNFRVRVPEDMALEREQLRRLAGEGLLGWEGDEVVLTPLGRLFVRNVALVFDERLRRSQERPVFSRTV
jgi:oxygen-independent coproporphyrinogen III oxidase